MPTTNDTPATAGLCPAHGLAKVLRLNPTKLSASVGTWFDCPYPGCFNSTVHPHSTP